MSQTFPPDSGVGGRRWAKFAKYLHRAGTQVEVIAAQMETVSKSPWTDDVGDIAVHRYRHRFPRVLTQQPKSISDKLNYRWALMKLRMHCLGSPYDRANRDRETFLELFQKRMNAFEPEAVVVSGAPFNLLHYAAEVRDVYRGVAFIADLRDPWIGGHVYGYRSLSERREMEERRKEREVVGAFDLVTSPWRSVVDDLNSRHPGFRDKFWWLSHAWDREDFGHGTKGESSSIDMLYGGNLYEGFDAFLKNLSHAVRDGKRKVQIHTAQAGNLAEFANEGFRSAPNIQSKDFFGLASAAKRMLFLIPESGKNGFPTKLLEYAATGRPIAAVGYEGSLSHIIEDRGLGKFWRLEDVEDRPLKLFVDFDFHPDRDWVEEFECERVTKKFLDRVDDLMETGTVKDEK